MYVHTSWSIQEEGSIQRIPSVPKQILAVFKQRIPQEQWQEFDWGEHKERLIERCSDRVTRETRVFVRREIAKGRSWRKAGNGTVDDLSKSWRCGEYWGDKKRLRYNSTYGFLSEQAPWTNEKPDKWHQESWHKLCSLYRVQRMKINSCKTQELQRYDSYTFLFFF